MSLVSTGKIHRSAQELSAALLFFILALQLLNPAAFAVSSEAPNREEAIAAYAEACCLAAVDDESALLRFADASEVSADCRAEAAAAVEAGLVQGTFVDGKLLLRPKAQISRLEALVLLARFLPEPSVPGEAVAGAPAWAAKELARLEAAGFASALHDLEYAGGTPLAKEQLTSYCEMLASAYAASGSLSHPGYTLEKVVVLSRHNIRSPLSGSGSVLGDITPHEWFSWSSRPSELSTRGGVLETQMGQFFRKWLEQEGLFPENYMPEDGAVRFYANSMQRTIATAQYFSSGLLPVANVRIEHHEQLNKMDPVFTPQLQIASELRLFG